MYFEINKYLLRKMGWYNYTTSLGIGQKYPGYSLFESDPLVRYFIDVVEDKKCYLIKELSPKEKQKSKKSYKFIIVDYEPRKPLIDVVEFNSNSELFKLIIEHEACNEEYQKHFKINKIFKK